MNNQSSQLELAPRGPDAAVELFGLTPERLQLLKNTLARGTTDDEFQLFVHVCKTRRVDPFSKLIYPVKRYDSKLKAEVMALQSSIDYFRLAAERTGKYAGQRGPQWCGEDGQWVDVWLSKEQPRAARVGVLRKDFMEPLWAVALWDSYAQTYFDKQTQKWCLTQFWHRMGPLMLAKCAEALGLRRAVPEDLAGLYVGEEMEQADSGKPAALLGPSTEERAEFGAAMDGKKEQPAPKSLAGIVERANAAPVYTSAPEAMARPVEVLDRSTGEILSMPAEESPEELQCVNRHRARLASNADPSTMEGEAARDRDAFVIYQRREGERSSAEVKAKKEAEEARRAPPIYAWHPTSESVLEVAYPVKCGPWAEWCDQPIPKGEKNKLHLICVSAGGPPTWRTAALGKKGGARHVSLLELVAAYPTLDKEKKISDAFRVHFHRAACTLAMLVDGSAREPDPTPKEPGLFAE